ncbi:hypothetical protein [Nonomuraea dietziae]|uniref:hypothetical protein n=1 Tax=Nonomuraea dietziae TaxID=65515 RepID=UPI0031CF0930
MPEALRLRIAGFLGGRVGGGGHPDGGFSPAAPSGCAPSIRQTRLREGVAQLA